MTDLFEEVEGQLRSDQYRTLARKSLPWIAGLVVLLLVAGGGYWGYSHFQAKAEAKAADEYAQAVDAFTAGNQPEAVRLWTDLSKSSVKVYKSLALMHLGGVQLGDGKTAEAVKLFDEAASAAPDPLVGDAARLKSAFALLDTAAFTEIEGRLKPLMEEGRPYRVQAREALGFAKLMASNTAGARDDFVVISQMLDAPEGARTRARAAIELIDTGSAKAVPGAVRAAAALPPTGPVGPVLSSPIQGGQPTQPQSPAAGPQSTGPQ